VIVIVDYGMGNLRSVQKAFERIGRAAEVTDRPEQVFAADRLVVPGVGAFGDAMEALRTRHLIEPIRQFCASGRPYLGICLGLQVLFDESAEVAGLTNPGAPATGAMEQGLGIVPGRVVRFPTSVTKMGLKVPHMGWNVVRPEAGLPPPAPLSGSRRGVNVFPAGAASPLFDGVPEQGEYFYFAHSYYAVPQDERVIVGRTEYGTVFASAIRQGNIHATQFHPEKSQAAGLAMLENFVTKT
jgi:imidazole glycerol-phosphate synthase subunit HisH